MRIMSSIREHMELCRQAFGKNAYYEFMMAHGRDYRFNKKSFKGKRGEPKNCYGNSTMLAAMNPDLTYVEGKVTIHGVPLDHAWCVNEKGRVVDPTIINKGQVGEYFGVPFKTRYVKRAVMINKYFGLLDYFSATKTVPKLFELGLEAGQAWLLDQYPRKKR